ncbi:hypothetical protein [Geothrix alkalitolerans]|uniref:hypothetical protein n=1 Tax=Geothrix alkalitolerans TaxID=2922724 RepID=UPI001FAEB9A0|nr:hypothetical protein [Geothrix alkalitolerans]
MSNRSILLSVALACAATATAPLSAQKPAAPPVAQDEVLAWPPPPAPARIKWVAEYRNAFDVGAKKKRSFLDRLAGKSEDVIWLQRPLSVAVDGKGVIFVGDFTAGVVAMDPAAKRIWAFSTLSGTALATPTGLAVDSKLVYAASANTNQVVVFDKEGHQLSALTKNDGINRPVGLAVDEDRDLLLVVNGGEHTVRLYNRSLKLLKTIGGRGSEEGQFNFPSYTCIVPGVGFAVVDTGNFRIQIFDFNGRFIRAFGKAGDMPGQVSRPKGIAVDPDGHLYVVDGAFCNFQIFDQEGRILLPVGTGGTRKGQFQVPTGIAIDGSGGIYVADQINGRIQKFQYLREEKGAPAPPSTPQ